MKIFGVAEVRQERRRRPSISDSAFPASAYTPPKTQRHVRLAPVEQTSAAEVEITPCSSSSNLAPVAATQADGEYRQRSSREEKLKAVDKQQGGKKDRKREARSKS